jgi:hypothetical protein
MNKAADTITTRFMKCVDGIMVRDRCDRATAMEKARKENEDLFDAYQLV